MGDIEIKYLTKKELKVSLEQNTYWNNEKLVPFSRNKALWICKNKRVHDDDCSAVIALENHKLIGFIYLMPDLMNFNGSEKKVSWLIYWWVSEKYKNNVLATYIYNEALSKAKNQVIIKSYAEHIAPFYNKMPFKIISSRLRYTIFFSLDASILLAKYKFLKYFKGLVKLSDQLSRSLVTFINSKKSQKHTKKIHYEYVNELDNNTWAFIEPLCKNDLIIKTKHYVNWQISPMQYVKTPVRKTWYSALENGTSKNISIFNLKIFKDKKIIGFISYIINHNELNVKYFLVKEDHNYNACVDVLMQQLIKLKRTFLFTDDSKLAENIQKRYKTIFTHKVTKNALAHNDLKIDSSSAVTNQDGHFY